MSASLPYLASNKNVEALFSAIQSAKIPDRFTQEFLGTKLGLKAMNDRAMIPLLRNLGFLDQMGSPTPSYRQLKNKGTAKLAISIGIKLAYSPLFEANEDANALIGEKLKGLIAQVAGTDDDMTSRIAQTFNALVKQGDFSQKIDKTEPSLQNENSEEVEMPKKSEIENIKPNPIFPTKGLNPEFHYNIQIHLPSNATEEVYINIFNAIRRVFQ